MNRVTTNSDEVYKIYSHNSAIHFSVHVTEKQEVGG
jgi:hypothetical protein